jgi:hypothetical protein
LLSGVVDSPRLRWVIWFIRGCSFSPALHQRQGSGFEKIGWCSDSLESSQGLDLN